METAQRVRTATAIAVDEEATIYQRTSRLLGLSAAVHSEVGLAARLEKGLSVNVVQALRSRLGLTDEEVYQHIAPRRTLNRREAERQSLSSDEADRAVRIARAAAHAQQVFSSKPAYAMEWMRKSQPNLAGRSPLQMLSSESGARAVEEVLLGLEHGFFA